MLTNTLQSGGLYLPTTQITAPVLTSTSQIKTPNYSGSSGSNILGSLGGIVSGGGSVDGAISIAANAVVPGLGAVVAPFLGELNLSENISNVLKYGLNSWGASTNPSTMDGHIQFWRAQILQSINGLNADNLEEVLNHVERFSKWGYNHYVDMRKNHARANSTKAAYDNAKAFFLEQTKLVPQIIQKLKQQGSTVSFRSVTEKAQYPDKDGKLLGASDPSFTYYVYTIKYVAPVLTQPEVSADESGNVVVGTKANYASMSWLVIALVLGWLFASPAQMKKITESIKT